MNNPNSLNIILNDSLSIDDLVALNNAGESVLRSAHVGNFSPYNLTLAEAGIPLLLVDHTITGALDPDLKGVDRNYFPEAVKTQAGNTIVAPSLQLTARARTDTSKLPPGVLQDMTAGQDFLDDLHINALGKAIPGTTAFTNTAYLRDNESITGEITQLAIQEFATLFKRTVMPDGSVRQTMSAASIAARQGVVQLIDDPRAEVEAAILPLEIDIIAGFIIEALKTGSDQQFHVTGKDMPDYVLGGNAPLAPSLQRCFETIKSRASFGKDLPEQLTVHLVPASVAKFATTMSRREAMENLVMATRGANAILQQDARDRRAFFTTAGNGNGPERKSFEQKARQQRLVAGSLITSAMTAIPEAFVPARTPGFVTQYDVALEGGLFVHPINRSASMAQLASMGNFITAVATGKKPTLFDDQSDKLE